MNSTLLPPILSFDAATFMEHASMMSREHILTRLAQKTLVLHSTPPQGRHQNSNRAGYTKIQNNLYHYINPPLLPKIYRSTWLENTFSKLRSVHRKTLLSKLSEKNESPILYIWHPVFSNEIGRYNESLVIYHIYDDYPNLPGATQDLVNKEIDILKKADIVFCANKSLIEAREKIVPRKYIHLPQGVDFSAFSKSLENISQPYDIATINHPRIGYIGRINKKVNFDLIDKIAAKKTTWNFIFVGPLDREVANATEIKSLNSKSNTHFLGPKDYKNVPDYWNAIDIAIIPYNHEPGQWAFYGSPLKLQEAFAAGKCVVISPLNEAKAYGELIKVAETSEHWINAIEIALTETGDEKKINERVDYAARNSWDSRVSFIEETIRCNLNKPK